MMAAANQEVDSGGSPIIELCAVDKHFSTGGSILPWKHAGVIHAVDQVSLGLYPGKITALVGESGSGKSTVARMLARLYSPTAGSILFQGKDVIQGGSNDMRAYRRQVQMIFQDPFSSLNPVKRVEYVLSRPLRVHKIVPPTQVRQRVHELLATVGLVPEEEFAAKFPYELSGGQRQRVSIARALAVEPTVLIADEPISMLDVSIRMGILNLMLELKRQTNLAFLYITHDIASARYVADEVIVMYAGYVVERGDTETVLQTPLHPYTRLLLSAVPNPDAGLKRQRLEARGEIRTIVDPQPGCRFADRCPAVVEPCRHTTPELIEVQPRHWVRCYLYPQSSASKERNDHE